MGWSMAFGFVLGVGLGCILALAAEEPAIRKAARADLLQEAVERGAGDWRLTDEGERVFVWREEEQCPATK